MSAPATSDDRPAPGRPSHPSPHRHQVAPWSLWFELIGAPIAWLLQLSVSVSMGGYACYPHDAPLAAPLWGNLVGMILWVEVIALLICLAAGVVSYLNWRRTSREKPGDAHNVLGGGDGRSRFLAMAGMLVSVLFLIATSFAIGNLATIQPCGG